MKDVEASEAAIAALAPSGTLRAAINLSNFLLVSEVGADGTPVGVSPDLSTALADRLGVPIELVTYANPGELADAVEEWDTGNIGAEPQRAERINFTSAYAEIEGTFVVPAGSPLRDVFGSRPTRQSDSRKGTGRLLPVVGAKPRARAVGSDSQS